LYGKAGTYTTNFLIGFDHWERIVAAFVLLEHNFLFMHIYSLFLMQTE